MATIEELARHEVHETAQRAVAHRARELGVEVYELQESFPPLIMNLDGRFRRVFVAGRRDLKNPSTHNLVAVHRANHPDDVVGLVLLQNGTSSVYLIPVTAWNEPDLTFGFGLANGRPSYMIKINDASLRLIEHYRL